MPVMPFIADWYTDTGSVFQVASQFNCLEMVGPGERPEDGITQYFLDKTQGPGSSASCIHAFYAASIADFAHRKTACAMACPAATLFRNYFCPVKRCAQLSASACAVRLPVLTLCEPSPVSSMKARRWSGLGS